MRKLHAARARASEQPGSSETSLAMEAWCTISLHIELLTGLCQAVVTAMPHDCARRQYAFDGRPYLRLMRSLIMSTMDICVNIEDLQSDVMVGTSSEEWAANREVRKQNEIGQWLRNAVSTALLGMLIGCSPLRVPQFAWLWMELLLDDDICNFFIGSSILNLPAFRGVGTAFASCVIALGQAVESMSADPLLVAQKTAPFLATNLNMLLRKLTANHQAFLDEYCVLLVSVQAVREFFLLEVGPSRADRFIKNSVLRGGKKKRSGSVASSYHVSFCSAAMRTLGIEPVCSCSSEGKEESFEEWNGVMRTVATMIVGVYDCCVAVGTVLAVVATDLATVSGRRQAAMAILAHANTLVLLIETVVSVHRERCRHCAVSSCTRLTAALEKTATALVDGWIFVTRLSSAASRCLQALVTRCEFNKESRMFRPMLVGAVKARLRTIILRIDGCKARDEVAIREVGGRYWDVVNSLDNFLTNVESTDRANGD